MTTSKSLDVFWKQVADSGLMDVQQVSSVARSLDAESLSTDAAAARKLVDLGFLTRFQADRLLEGKSRGFFFDQYKVLDLVGVGGMGWVYRANDRKTGQEAALKVLLDQFKNDQGMVVRFEQEARAGLKFDHPNLVRTFGHGTAGGLPYIAMEYMQGASLLELLRLRERSRLPYAQACEIARQAAAGLQHMHNAGYVHRDIKPQNLLVDHSGLVKILDFGLTMQHEGESGDEFSMAMIFGHECVGTAAFMAPEQAKDSLKADARADVYGLGCTLYAMLIGETPFPYIETKEILKAHRSQIPKRVSEIVPSIPQPVADIVAKTLQKKPEDRYATAQEVVDALAVWSQSGPVEFDFEKILADRNKLARQKLAEMQRRQKSSVNSASSTAKPSAVSSVTSASTTSAMPAVGIDSRAKAFTSSIVKRDPFGFEHPPSIVVRGTEKPVAKDVTPVAKPIESNLELIPLGGGAAVPINRSRFLIGRGAMCDLQVKDNSVSTRHCELVFEIDGWVLNDLNSRNGVRVNGDVIKSRRLNPGDVIIVGPTLRLRLASQRTQLNWRKWIAWSLSGLSVIVLLVLIAWIWKAR